ncbi:unnamed protein product [Dicrocoelium dendriticum]|nr:unnamed protein product [Dicrocoelium dendriticum]
MIVVLLHLTIRLRNVYLLRILNLLVPSGVRVLTRRFCTWFLFQNHCIYQILYAFILLAGHYLLISRVISILYRYLEWENHLFITLACLFFNCLSYTMVCLTDPGVITPRNIPLFSKVYSYDNVVYSPMECGSCAHLIPARARHCARCDHCVYRFEHHCLWTNCCIGGLN